MTDDMHASRPRFWGWISELRQVARWPAVLVALCLFLVSLPADAAMWLAERGLTPSDPQQPVVVKTTVATVTADPRVRADPKVAPAPAATLPRPVVVLNETWSDVGPVRLVTAPLSRGFAHAHPPSTAPPHHA